MTTTSNRTTTITPPPGMLPNYNDKPLRSSVLPSATSLMDQMKTLSVSSTPVPTTTTSSITPYLSEYEVVDTSTQSIKKPTTNIASFPPRQNASLFTIEKPLSTLNNTTNGHYSSLLLNDVIKNDHPKLQSKPNVNNKNEILNSQQRDTPISAFSNEGSIRFGNTSGPQTTSVTPST
jgi:hypothetical protein